MVIVSKEPIEGIRPGRKDYSSSVTVNPIPVLRGPQKEASYRHTFSDIGPGETATHISDEFDYSHFMTNMVVSTTANVWLEFVFYVEKADTGKWMESIHLSGYQHLERLITMGFPCQKIKLELTNYGDVTVDAVYSHMGVKGIELLTGSTGVTYLEPTP